MVSKRFPKVTVDSHIHVYVLAAEATTLTERVSHDVCMYVRIQQEKDQPGKVANPARGQLNREK